MSEATASDLLKSLARGEEGVRDAVAMLEILRIRSASEVANRLLSWSERWSGPPEAWVGNLLDSLVASPDPEMAMLLWERWLEADDEPWKHAYGGEYCTVLTALFSQSQFLADVLIAKPSLADWVLDHGALDDPWQIARLQTDLREVMEGTAIADQRRLLCEWRRRHMLRIGLRDILDRAQVETLTRELADLAEVVIQSSLDHVWEEVTKRWGEPRTEAGGPAGLAVLGMGKLGGRELNFSSDVDLIFIYTDEGETTGKGPNREGCVPNHRFMRRLCERLIEHIAAIGPEGRLYRVDMRLRPEGAVGPIARSVESFQIYFDSQARLWERLAYTKARIVAQRGDDKLAERIDVITQRFVYGEKPSPELPMVLAELKHRIDREVANSVGADTEVKRGSGGIREIEFVTGLFQLLHGPNHSDLRTRGLLETLRGLMRRRLLSEAAVTRLRRAYETLRRIEHRLQMMSEFQTHTLPSEPKALTLLARRLGWMGEDDATVRRRFLADYNQISSMVHQAFLQHIGAPELTDLMADVGILLDDNTAPEQAAQVLARFGFTEPASAVTVVRNLGRGGRGAYMEASAQRSFERLLPALLAWCPQIPSPDLAMRQLAGFVDAYKARGTLFALMREQPQLVEVLMRLFGGSALLGQTLISQPQHFETVVAQGLGLALPSDVLSELWERMTPRDPNDTKRLLDAMRTMNQMVRLAISLRHLLDLDSWERFAEQLTELHEFLLVRAWRTVVDEGSEEPFPIACIALGKFGGRELNVGSDIDVILVCQAPSDLDEPDTMEWIHTMTRRVERLVTAANEPTRRGTLFEIDVRLRPDGRNAPLLCSAKRLESYFAADAQLWEFQTFLRARPVAGDMELGRRVIERVHTAMRSRLGAMDLRGEIAQMRRRLAENADHPGGQGSVDFKRDPGGIVDIEFLVQLAQLEALRDHGATPDVNTAKAIATLDDWGGFALRDRTAMRRLLLTLRALECRLRLLQGSSSSAVPPDAERWRQLAVAHLGSRHTADEMRAHAAKLMAEVREMFNRGMSG